VAKRYECIPILEDEGTMILENVGNFNYLHGGTCLKI
jgi:hypothetical protein